MNNSNDKTEVYLLPGDFYFGDKNCRISTLLGSCVAITLWHPQKQIGGMCHYMLPLQTSGLKSALLDGKYAEDAIQMFLKEIKHANTLPSEYQAKVFGGGDMFSKVVDSPQCTPKSTTCFSSFNCKKVSCKNALIADYLLQQNSIKVVNFDIGGTQHRKIIFEIDNGDVWVRRGQ